MSLVSGFPSPERQNRLMLMFQIYVDESVSDDPPVYVMAGFISTAEKWASFSDEWRQRCEMKPRIAYFKMSEAMGFGGEFAGFSEESRNEKIMFLDSLIQEHVMGSIAIVLDHAAYKALFGNPTVPKELRSPYYFLAMQMMKELPHFQDHFNIGSGIDFLFDEQVGEMNRIVAAWEDFKVYSGVPWSRLSSIPVFRDEKKVLPLQAADMLAWITRKRTEDGLLRNPPTKLPLFKGRGEVPFLLFPYDRTALERLYREVTQEPRLHFTFGRWRYVQLLNARTGPHLPAAPLLWTRRN
ncbi:DUF3800 domain-containing protein [Bradyrhizobium sp. USDA 3315]